MEIKKCKCGGDRDYVIKSGKRAGKFHTYCRKCLSAQVADWTKRNADYCREKQRQWWKDHPRNSIRAHMRRYGTDEVWFLAKHEEQNGLCAICHRPETVRFNPKTGKPVRLSVDHNHATGQLRGLLCTICNTRLATLEMDHWLEKAAEYLAQYQP